MPTIDTLAVRFEADAQELFSQLDTLESRLNALREGRTQTLPAMNDVHMQLTVTADEAISRAVQGAQQAMAAALQSAVDKLSASIEITVPVTISGQRVASAATSTMTQRALSRGVSILECR